MLGSAAASVRIGLPHAVGAFGAIRQINDLRVTLRVGRLPLALPVR